MTIKVTIPQANQQFSQLIESVLQGEEIIICEDNEQSVPIARITAIHPTKKTEFLDKIEVKLLFPQTLMNLYLMIF